MLEAGINDIRDLSRQVPSLQVQSSTSVAAVNYRLRRYALGMAAGVLLGAVVADAARADGNRTGGTGLHRIRVTTSLLLTGLTWALLMGLLGGLFPALRAARLPISKALREL